QFFLDDFLFSRHHSCPRSAFRNELKRFFAASRCARTRKPIFVLGDQFRNALVCPEVRQGEIHEVLIATEN
ncbi:hypothetical protein, partial [Hoeflea sp.]|uniref:hypothetical protein n=1 Tax=Hoeflea sp. TaxID=1940281 RepID=UPI0025C0E73A